MVIEFWLGISEPTVMFLWVPSRENLTLEFAGFFDRQDIELQIEPCVFKNLAFNVLYQTGKLGKLAGAFNFKVLIKAYRRARVFSF